MKKSFSVLFTTILISGFLTNENIKTNVGCCENDVVISPELGSNPRIEKLLLNEGSTALACCPLGTYSIFGAEYSGDSKIHCKFRDLEEKGRLEQVRKKKFAVLIDSAKGPIDYKFLEKGESAFLECDFILPPDSDFLDIHIYGQNDDDPNFLVREENFLCKIKFLSCNGTFLYNKKQQNCVSYYDEDGNLAQGKLDIYQMIVPNFFAIPLHNKISEVEAPKIMAVLDLPDGKNNIVQYEDRVFSFMKLLGEYATWPQGSVMPIYKDFLIVKVPEDVNDVSLKLYSTSTQQGYGGDIKYVGEYKFNLNRE